MNPHLYVICSCAAHKGGFISFIHNLLWPMVIEPMQKNPRHLNVWMTFMHPQFTKYILMETKTSTNIFKEFVIMIYPVPKCNILLGVY